MTTTQLVLFAGPEQLALFELPPSPPKGQPMHPAPRRGAFLRVLDRIRGYFR